MAVAAMAGLSSCSEKENITSPEIPSGGIPYEVSTVITKTTNDGLATKWASSDAINIYHAEAGASEYVSDGQFTVDAALAGNFSGKLASALEDGKTYDWYANYPYTAQKTTPTAGTTGTLTIGGLTQTQTGNSSTAHLCGQACPLYGVVKGVASSDKPSLTMKNLASVIAVKVKNASSSELTVTKVEFTSTEDIVGTYYIDYTGESPVYTAAEANATATLDVTGAGAIAVNSEEIFYLAVKPHKVSKDATLTVAVNGLKQNFKLTADYTFKAGKMCPLTYEYVSVPVAKENLVLYLPFESAEVGTGDVAVAAKSASADANFVAGRTGKAFTGGENQYLLYDVAAGSPIRDIKGYTLSAWIMQAEIPYTQAPTPMFFQITGTGTDRTWGNLSISIDRTAAGAGYLTYKSVARFSGGNLWKTWNNGYGSCYPAGVWNHLVFIYDNAASEYHVYVNGVDVTPKSDVTCMNGSAPVGDLGFSAADQIIVGAWAPKALDSATDEWMGWLDGGAIDELRLYNRALTADEVAALYSEESAIVNK